MSVKPDPIKEKAKNEQLVPVQWTVPELPEDPTDDGDDELAETPAFVVAVLGFDPKDDKPTQEDTTMPKNPFTTKDYVAAFRKLHLLPHQIRMLQANFYADDRTITATQLAHAMSYKNYNAANLQYGKLAGLVGEELGWKPMPRTKLRVFVDFARPAGEWLWTLKKEVASAIQELGWADEDSTTIAEELDSTRPLYEGAVKIIRVNAFERNAAAREKCLLHHGCQCSVCGVVLADVYGEIAQGFIHVHHLKPMAEIDANYRIDPIKDLRPVCPTCHAVIHLRKPPFSITEAKSLLAKAR